MDELVARLKELGARSVRPLEGVEENMAFPLPKGLSLKKQQAEAAGAATTGAPAPIAQAGSAPVAQSASVTAVPQAAGPAPYTL